MHRYSEERKKEQGSVKEAERNTGKETEKQETEPQRGWATRSKVLNIPAGCQRREHGRRRVTLMLLATPALPRVLGCLLVQRQQQQRRGQECGHCFPGDWFSAAQKVQEAIRRQCGKVKKGFL